MDIYGTILLKLGGVVMASIEARLGEKFINRSYNESELFAYLQESKYVDIEFIHDEPPRKGFTVATMKVFHMKFYNDDRTLFVGINEDGNVGHFKIEDRKINSYPEINYGAAIGCLLVVITVIVLVIWMLFSFISDGVDSWNEEEEFNPYTEDYDGDGLNGDQDDHDILHQMPTMPTEPIDE
jgi:hypothetical protein